MDIYRAEKIAQDRMCEAGAGEWDKSFTLIGLNGIRKCEWLDPYFGLFKMDGEEGMFKTSQVPAGVECIMSDGPVGDNVP